MKNKTIFYVGAGALLLSLFLIATMIYKKERRSQLSTMAIENGELFVRDYSPRYGNKKAKVIVTEFLDPECESCRMLYPLVKDLLNEYPNQVQLVIRYAPFHGNSALAIKALEAARLQGKYWEVLETLFAFQPYWGDHHNPRPELIFEYLKNFNLDMDKIRKDMESPKIAHIIQQDEADLKQLNVRATPTFFVNGRALEKFGIEYLKKLVHEEVTAKYED